MSQKTKVLLTNLVLILSGVFLVTVIVGAWTSPTEDPPGGNVSTPINIGDVAQTKSGLFTAGDLVSNGGIIGTTGVTAPAFYDRNDITFFIDPASTSRFNQINLGGETRNSWPVAAAETDPTVLASVKDGVSWGEVTGKPSLTETDPTVLASVKDGISWSEVSSKPTPNFRMYEKVCSNCNGTVLCCNNYNKEAMLSGGFAGGPWNCAGGKGWICGPGICYMFCGYITW